MKPADRIRSFIALDIGAEVRAALAAVVQELEGVGGDARWVRPEGMHTTLKFLGGVEPTRLDRVRVAVARVAAERSPLRMHVRRLGAFPSLQRPRVLWAGVDCPGLAELAGAVDAAVSEIGFAPEGRPFSAHITLARLRSLKGWEKLAGAVHAHASDEFGQVVVRDIVIYRSTLCPQGAVHTALWTIPLAQHK